MASDTKQDGANKSDHAWSDHACVSCTPLKRPLRMRALLNREGSSITCTFHTCTGHRLATAAVWNYASPAAEYTATQHMLNASIGKCVWLEAQISKPGGAFVDPQLDVSRVLPGPVCQSLDAKYKWLATDCPCNTLAENDTHLVESSKISLHPIPVENATVAASVNEASSPVLSSATAAVSSQVHVRRATHVSALMPPPPPPRNASPRDWREYARECDRFALLWSSASQDAWSHALEQTAKQKDIIK